MKLSNSRKRKTSAKKPFYLSNPECKAKQGLNSKTILSRVSHGLCYPLKHLKTNITFQDMPSPAPSPIRTRGRPKGSTESSKRKAPEDYSDNKNTKKSRKYAKKLKAHNPLRYKLRQWTTADSVAKTNAKKKVREKAEYEAASVEDQENMIAQVIKSCEYSRYVGDHSNYLSNHA